MPDAVSIDHLAEFSRPEAIRSIAAVPDYEPARRCRSSIDDRAHRICSERSEYHKPHQTAGFPADTMTKIEAGTI